MLFELLLELLEGSAGVAVQDSDEEVDMVLPQSWSSASSSSTARSNISHVFVPFPDGIDHQVRELKVFGNAVEALSSQSCLNNLLSELEQYRLMVTSWHYV